MLDHQLEGLDRKLLSPDELHYVGKIKPLLDKANTLSPQFSTHIQTFTNKVEERKQKAEDILAQKPGALYKDLLTIKAAEDKAQEVACNTHAELQQILVNLRKEIMKLNVPAKYTNVLLHEEKEITAEAFSKNPTTVFLRGGGPQLTAFWMEYGRVKTHTLSINDSAHVRESIWPGSDSPSFKSLLAFCYKPLRAELLARQSEHFSSLQLAGDLLELRQEFKLEVDKIVKKITPEMREMKEPLRPRPPTPVPMPSIQALLKENPAMIPTVSSSSARSSVSSPPSSVHSTPRSSVSVSVLPTHKRDSSILVVSQPQVNPQVFLAPPLPQLPVQPDREQQRLLEERRRQEEDKKGCCLTM